MTDQNQGQAQVNGQPVMGGNPYDLVDSKGQTVENTEVSSVDTVVATSNNVNVPAVEQVQQPVAPVQSEQTVNQPVQPVANQPVPAKVYKGPGGFTKKLVSFLAKLSGQPDPETGTAVPVAAVNNTAVAAQPGQTPVEPVPVAKSASPFDSIMGGVTGFLDKVESKMESAAGVDLNAPVNKPAETVVPVAQAIVPEVSPAPVTPVVEEKKVAEVVKPIETTGPVEEIKQTEQNIEVKNTAEEVKSPATAVKTEIESVEKNENVPVNPISENIQFGESKPTQ